jgi:predicted amidohydrolase
MEATTMDQAADAWMVVERLAAKAADAGADLFVLPELTYPAYYLESTERYMQSDIQRSPAVLERFSKLAAKHAFWIVVGFVEEDQGRLYNSAAVFDRQGRTTGIARKNFLWDFDHQWFTPGNSLSVFDTEFGKMGVLICADARVPEIPATLISDGARFIVQPTAWVNTSNVRRTYRNIQPDFLIRARATEFGVPFISCSKSGREAAALEYVGQSQIVSAQANVLAQAPLGGEHLIVAEVQPGPPHPLEFDEASRSRLLSTDPPYRPEQPAGKCTVRLREDIERIAAALEEARARPARLKVADLKSFALSRCPVLDGAAVLLIQGRILDDVLVRTRAAENRVFAIVASDAAHLVVDPDGTIAWRRTDWNDTLELDLGLANLKQFNPRTDMWTQRRVECYRLGAPSPS